MIELRSISKHYPGGVEAVTDLSMEIGSGELCVLVGPSGSGKTTTLKMINRLIEPSSGEILFDEQNVLELDPVQLRRRIGYVMQQGGLFPHLRVAENVATVPRLLGWDKGRVARRVEELLDLVGLEPGRYLRRYPHELSGGERQRVGVARALGGDPPVLLMDEPFSAVDPIQRKRLQQEFLELKQQLNKTVVFVTHDIEEALLLGTKIAIMERRGMLEQYDTPSAILAKPATPFVAEFVGVDRDLQRLSVSDLGRDDLIVAPVLARTASLAEAIAALDDAASDYGIVLDHDGGPSAYVARSDGAAVRTFEDALRPLGEGIALGTTLKSALAAMLRRDDELLPVYDPSGLVGLLTLEGLYRAMRRSAGSPLDE